MIPQIFQLGPLPINSFGLAVALGILAGIKLLERSFAANNIPVKLAERYALTAGIVGLLGARLWYVFVDFYSEVKHDLIAALFSSAGFTFYGGFILSTIVLLIMSRIDRIPLARFLDSLGPALTIAYAIGRLGCQLSGDGDYGIATESIFGMSYSTGVIPTAPGVLVFPTPLYESFMAFLILAVLLKLEKIPAMIARPYSRFGSYLALIASERFLIEFLRINRKFSYGLSQAQFIAIGLIVIGIFMIVASRLKNRKLLV